MNIELPLDGPARKRLRPVSRAVFQSMYALEVLVAIAQADRFYQAELAGLAGCQPNYAGEFMKRLAAGRLIEPVPTEPGQNRIYYRRLPSPLWDLCLRWATVLLAGEEPDVPRLSDRR